jgi:hypothetical protein
MFFGVTVPAFAYTVTNSGAGDHGDFVLEPGKIEIYLNPGESVVKNVAVTSRINRKQKFRITTEDFIGSQNPETPVVLLGNDKSPYSFKDNLKPDVKDFSLDLGQKIEIPVTVTAPKDAQPGGFYSSVIVSSVPDNNPDGSAAGTRLISRVGVLFFVRVNGDVKESGSLEEMRVTGPRLGFLQGGPLSFEMLFRNSGNIHLVPYGVITVTNIFGQKVTELPVDAYFALPNSLRYRQVTWPKEFLFGYYKAHLEMHRGYSDIVDTKDVGFWVLPWMYIGSIALVIFVIFTLFYLFTKKFELKKR